MLLQEALEGLSLRDDGWYVDATYGRGGHSAEILARLGSQGRLLALDKDADAVADARERFGADARFGIVHAGFEELAAVAAPWLGKRRLAGILFDLGVSSPQLDVPDRGFSFAHDGPLDMRMNRAHGPTAAEWLANVPQTELVDVLFRYGEEPRARQIAAAIVRTRATEPLTTTRQLASLVAAACRPARPSAFIPRRARSRRFASRSTTSSVRSSGASRRASRCSPDSGRLVVISFHSLEDRIVKRFMAREARGDEAYAGLPNIPPHARPRLKLVGKLVRPGTAEVERNPRARSARLRVAERMPLEQRRMNKQLLELVGVLLLAAGVVASGIWIVDVEHRSRQLFIQAEGLSRELDQLQIEWGQLQIEQSTQGTHSRIEALARQRLQLTEPSDNQLVVVREPPR